jgi:hypothetical protein
MVKGVKPYLGGIQEFGVAAYVKDLNAGKLDPRAVKGRFVGYDTESKGYRIYWPEKRSISIERNVAFNPEDLLTSETVVVPGDVLAEGERDKVIQNESGDGEAKNEGEDVKDVEKDRIPDSPPLIPPTTQDEPPIANLTPQASKIRTSDTLPEPEPNTGRGFQSRHKPSVYARMNDGLDPLEANIVLQSFSMMRNLGHSILAMLVRDGSRCQPNSHWQGPWTTNWCRSKKRWQDPTQESGKLRGRKRLVG